MKYLIVDAALSGTGIRDKYEGGYLEPEDLGLSQALINHLRDWLLRYENEHYFGYANSSLIDKLDLEGIEIALMIKNEITDVKIEYYSDAKLSRTLL